MNVDRPADLVLHGGSVITVDPDDRVAEAVAVTGGLITAVGGAEVRGLVGPRTKVVDLAGGAVLPGINDSHLHAAMLGAYWPDTWLGGAGFPQPRELRSRADRIAAIRLAWEVLVPLGITSYTEPGLGPGARGQHGGGCDDEVLAAYRELADADELRARVNVLLLFGELDGPGELADFADGLRAAELVDPPGPWRLRVRGVKLFADGIPPMRTAWMTEPYLDGGCGAPLVPEADLRTMVALAHEAGCQVGVHATGDRAIAETVDAFTAAVAGRPGGDHRHYVIHGDCVPEPVLRTMAGHGIGLNAQPGIHAATEPALRAAIGTERTERAVPLRSALDTGVPLCLGSDGPVLAPDWRHGIAAAMGRGMTVPEALRAYTITGAWQDHAEGWKGSIEVGKVADLCVLAADPLTVPAREIPGIEVVMTVLDGQVVFERGA